MGSCFYFEGSLGAPAWAQEDGATQRVLVGTLSGAKTQSARGWIVEGLSADSRFEVLPEDQSAIESDASQSQIAEIALAHQADAVILGRSRFHSKKGWGAALSIYDGRDGSLIETTDVPGGSFEEYEAALVGGAAYFSIIEKAQGIPEEATGGDLEASPSEEEVAPTEEEPVATVEDKPGRPSPLDMTFGIRFYGRSLRYTGTMPSPFPRPADYNLDVGPMPLVHLNWYPAAHFTGSWVAHLAITGGYERGVGTTVAYSDPATLTQQEFGQVHQLWWAGLRGRIPVKMFTFGIEGTFGQHTFGLAQRDATVDPGTIYPNITYSIVELAADGEVTVGKVKLGGKAGFILPLGFGDLKSEDWFSETKGIGVQYRGHVGFSVLPALDILAGIEGRTYALNFNPVPVLDSDDQPRAKEKVAGGATDQYVSAFFALRVLIPEKKAQAGPASAEGGDEASDDGFGGFD